MSNYDVVLLIFSITNYIKYLQGGLWDSISLFFTLPRFYFDFWFLKTKETNIISKWCSFHQKRNETKLKISTFPDCLIICRAVPSFANLSQKFWTRSRRPDFARPSRIRSSLWSEKSKSEKYSHLRFFIISYFFMNLWVFCGCDKRVLK